MRAAVCPEHGPVTNVVVVEQPDLVPGPGQALVQVEAAAVNFPDVLVCANDYQVKVPAPFVVGSELAGTVSAVGEGVGPEWVGRRVMGTSLFGAFAEQALMSPRQLQQVPDGLDAVHAAAFGVTFTTSWHALVTVGAAQKGDWVVVLGASGGVGTAAVEIAVRLGCRVIAVASSAERVELCRSLGAEAGIDHSTQDVKEEIKRITGGGADVVIDPVGGPLAEASLRACRFGARFVVVGFASGEIPRIPLNLVLLKGVIIKGLELRSLYENLPDAERACHEGLSALVAQGMQPHVSRVLPLGSAVEALLDVAERRVQGKIVIDVLA